MKIQNELEQKIILATQCFAHSLKPAHAIVADISLLVEATSTLSLSNMEYWERLIRHVFSATLYTEREASWPTRPKKRTFLTWIDLCSPDGHERERTLRSLTGAAPNGFFFAIALRRLNDWVPQVREAARETIPLIAQLSRPIYVVEALMAVMAHWDSWGRMAAEDKQILLDIISNEKIAEVFIAMMMSTNTGALGAMFSQLGRTPILDPYLIDLAKNAIQPAIRAKAYRSLFVGKMTWIEGRKWEWIDIRYCKGQLQAIYSSRPLTIASPFDETLRMAALDRSALVRRVAAEMLIRKWDKLGPEAMQLAHLFAADRSAAVARRGLFALKNLPAKTASPVEPPSL